MLKLHFLTRAVYRESINYFQITHFYNIVVFIILSFIKIFNANLNFVVIQLSFSIVYHSFIEPLIRTLSESLNDYPCNYSNSIKLQKIEKVQCSLYTWLRSYVIPPSLDTAIIQNSETRLQNTWGKLKCLYSKTQTLFFRYNSKLKIFQKLLTNTTTT